MTFLEAITQHWSIIIFIGGAVFNLGYAWSRTNQQEKDIKLAHQKCKELEKEVEKSNTDYSDLKGDIKAINTKLDLLLAGKIK